jgi:hypothetical protein
MEARKAKHFNILYRIGIICSRSLKKYQKPTISFMFSDSGDTVFSTIQSYISFFSFFFFHFSFIIHMCIQGLVHFSFYPSLEDSEEAKKPGLTAS